MKQINLPLNSEIFLKHFSSGKAEQNLMESKCELDSWKVLSLYGNNTCCNLRLQCWSHDVGNCS